MCNELLTIINKITCENPDVKVIRSDWTPDDCSGCIYVYIPNISFDNRTDFNVKYTEWVKRTFGSNMLFEDKDTLVCASPSPLYEDETRIVYDSDKGGFV